MYQNPSLDTALIAILLVSLTLLFILAAMDLANTQNGSSSVDEDPAFIDFVRP